MEASNKESSLAIKKALKKHWVPSEDTGEDTDDVTDDETDEKESSP